VPAEAGRLVPPGDPDALATALRELLADAGRRAGMGEAGRAESARYAWPRVAERTLAVYERVSARRKSIVTR
jgi:glycosyltransferase involved in cell wall biosynthesis